MHFVQSSTRSRRLSRLCRSTACEGWACAADVTRLPSGWPHELQGQARHAPASTLRASAGLTQMPLA